MRPRTAIATVLVFGLLVAAYAAFAGEDGTVVRAEFTSARGLLEKNEVRVQGAPAGSIETIELTPRNTAVVTLRLREGMPAPRADATAAIRPVDLLGDVYLAFDPGTSPQPLQGTIATDRTSNAPRLDELLRAFAPEARDGLRALIVGLGQGLDRRGGDVQRAVLRLRPALEATDALMEELDDQRSALRDLIGDAHRATRQLASRRRDLGTTVEALGTTLSAVADRSTALDQGLRRAPGLLARLTGTSRRLARTARAATPLARSLGESAPGLAAVAADLPAFASDARRAVQDTRPLIRDLGTTLQAARASAPRLASGLDALATASPALDRMTTALVPAAKPISEGFFVNFADQAAEPGNQPFDPFGDPARNYWRGAAVFSCEAFGLPVQAGCLSQYLGKQRSRGGRREPSRPSKPSASTPPSPRPTPARPAPRPALPKLPKLPDLPLGLDTALDDVLGAVVGQARGPRRPTGDGDLLNYLLGP